MIKDLDDTLAEFLVKAAPVTSSLALASVSFDIPNSEWRGKLEGLTVNCYLYDVRQNMAMRTEEPMLQRSTDGTRAVRLKPPARIDCAYCITAWSTASPISVADEHQLLSEVLQVLLLHQTIPVDYLKGSLQHQIPPYPTVIASADGIKDQPHFWASLHQELKPSLNYVITLAMSLDDRESGPIVRELVVGVGYPSSPKR